MPLEDEIKAARNQIVDGQEKIVKELMTMNHSLSKLARTAQLLAEHIAKQAPQEPENSD